MLKVSHLNAYYGAIEALHDVTIEVPDGIICCVIGANGSGKTTLLKAISGMVEKNGDIAFNGVKIGDLPGRKIARMGITHVPEGRHIFTKLTVEENLEAGAISWRDILGRTSVAEDLKTVYELFPRLEERKKQKGWSLSGGEQQMLAIGRALMSRPKLLMLDEPSMGLAPVVVDDLFDRIQAINREKHLSILLNEQNANVALDVSSYVYVFDNGKISFQGTAEEVRHDKRVAEAYLGKYVSS